MRNFGLRRVLLLSVILCCSAFLALSARAAEQAARRPMVALTFDDGPYSPVTGRILDVLECSDSRATFFVEGDRVSGCAPTVRRAAELGCQIGVHTWDHRCLMTQLSEEEIRAQLSATADAVSQASGIVPTLSRPVGGAVNDTVRRAIDYPMILWSVDTRDWESRDADAVCAEVLNSVQDGDIILMHDLYPSTAEAVERLVPVLIEQGYELVTVEELAQSRGAVLESHVRYFDFR